MTRDELKDILVQALQRATQRQVDRAVLIEDRKLREDLGLDSLDLVETVWAVEEKLGISIPESSLKTIATVEDVLVMVETALAEKAG